MLKANWVKISMEPLFQDEVLLWMSSVKRGCSFYRLGVGADCMTITSQTEVTNQDISR